MSGLVYSGALYLLDISEDPLVFVQVTTEEMAEKDWLVNLFVKNLPGRFNYGWHGACLRLSLNSSFNWADFDPKDGDEPGMLIYTPDEIHKAFLAHPVYCEYEWKYLADPTYRKYGGW
jgi:hypothetical protein